MRTADNGEVPRVRRFATKPRAGPQRAPALPDSDLPTDIRDLKRIRNRIVLLALSGLAALVVSWCAR